MSKRKAEEAPAPKLASIFTKKVKPAEEDNNQKSWKFVCWNVAGLRACVKKSDFKEVLAEEPDLVFLGETKCKEWPPEMEETFKNYTKTLVVSTEKNGGYAGVGLLSKCAPMKVHKGIGDPEFDTAGRLIIAEFSKFYFIGAYVPNSGAKLVNLEKRGRWEKLLTEKMKEMDEKKPVIYGGDLNVAHNEIDLKNPESNRNKTAGFTDQERGWFSEMLELGFTDTFRAMHPDEKKYSFWSYLANSRQKDVGWRLDYYVVSNRIMNKVKRSDIMSSVMGSDHAPVVMQIDF
ncbi:exodeoxyribonuclease III [Caenorhabditis elegans]|uniref:exodeoxyribonuclease III n=1 Tax=Caenorhabditis elegans TaxID=6239 RepID=G5EBR7_CAEEL|nr:DNA-(apurinic or apyrimidinic site) endonuclease [Caenorhabditis elegans]AAC82328.1 exonuclease III homolog [Caenorhabditis elegans]CAB03235.1 DNA-(apurinic or apyrimidinic site) endonuclease [Caenorhabditis elegans]|eukprot:NP_001021584.1 DNA-(apurinic or apyrimidinic site) lyase [Caenorhabditis elegans]